MKIFLLLMVTSTIFVGVACQEPGGPDGSTVQCDAQADLLFVMDSSGSVGSSNFLNMLKFLVNITRSFDIGPDNVQFGGIVFSDYAERVFDFNDYMNHVALEEAIMSIAYTEGGTETGRALALVADESLTAEYGARPDIPPIVLVFTDGRSNTPSDTADQGQVLRDAGVKVMSIGIGSGVNKAELEAIATTPNDVFTVTGFDVLNSIIRILNNKTCNLAQRPILHGPNIIGNTFNFKCEIDYDEPQEPDQVFEVTWVFDGEEDMNIPPQNLTDSSRVATLNGTKLYGHMPSDLQCKVRAYSNGNEGQARYYVYSRSYYLGIQSYPARIEISEKDESFEHVIINSTIPFLCDDDSTACCLTLTLDTDAGSDVAVGSACNYQLCQENSTAEFPVVEVPVVAKQDMISDGDKQLLLTFMPVLPTFLGPYMDIFYKHKPQQVQVRVKDQVTYTCSMTGDPHIAGFDYRTYHLFLVGDFIAYDVPEDLFQVQIRTWKCSGGGVTCICGVAIREKNDIIRINMCDQVLNGPITSPIVDAAYELREGTIVQRSEDGRTMGVYLPSGVEIKVTGTEAYLNVFVTGPGTHENKAKGICGTMDGNKENEFTHRDGTIDPICGDNDWKCRPDDFFRSWSVPANDSLFTTVPDRVDDADEDVEYCTCDEDEQKVTCERRANKEGTRTACSGCKDIKPVKRAENPGSRKNHDVTYEDVDEPDSPYDPTDQEEVDPNKQWSSVTGITEDQAREFCIQALKRSQLYSVCSGMMNMAQSYLTDCMSDILLSESTFFLDAITSAFTSDCQLTLAKDPANYVSSSDGQLIFKAEYLEDICDIACDKHGKCGEKGICLCDDGWEGVNCQIQSGIGPQLLNIRSGQLCDVAQRPCQKIFMDVSNIKLSDTLVCRLQSVDATGTKIGPPVETEAEFVSTNRISCGRSHTTSSSQHYRISASNDGDLFGNALPLHVFDSTCLDCTVDGCSEKDTACHIDGVCYRDGAVNPEDANKVCDVSKRNKSWTVKGRNAATTVGPCMWELLIPFIGFLSVCHYF